MAYQQQFFDDTFFGEQERVSKKEQLYRDHGASPDIMKLVRLGPKTLGSFCKKRMSHILDLTPKTSNQDYDGIYRTPSGPLRLKSKTSCYWGRKKRSGWKYDCRWQHIKETSDNQHDVLVLIEIGFTCVTYYILTSIIQDYLLSRGLIKLQGSRDKKDISQNFWVTGEVVRRYCDPIMNEVDLITTLNQINYE
jgi:hypothetical protein